MRSALVKGSTRNGEGEITMPAENALIETQLGKITSSVRSTASVPKANWLETFAVFAEVLLPTLAKGVIIRRPNMLAVAERFDLDRRAIRRMQRLRNKYPAGPL